MSELNEEVVHLARLALAGRGQDIHMFLRRLVKSIRKEFPDSATQIESLLEKNPTRSNPLRKAEAATAIPVDADTRLHLVRTEYPVAVECDPIWEPTVKARLLQVIAERKREGELVREGLHPTKTLLFTGKPGVGKSLAARWLAMSLNRPLVTLDLSAVMSSYLGRTGANLRYVLDYAKELEGSVLLLDELDAVAKRRDDDSDIGELKRLVTVLLQEIDSWPASGLLVAATNHPELLDRAAGRRFEMVIEFPMPEFSQVRDLVGGILSEKSVSDAVLEVTALAFRGESYSDIERELRRIHRESVIEGESVESRLKTYVKQRLHDLDLDARRRASSHLIEAGMSDRQTNEWTGLHRSAIAKLSKDERQSA